jgi:hypothetical protein
MGLRNCGRVQVGGADGLAAVVLRETGEGMRRWERMSRELLRPVPPMTPDDVTDHRGDAWVDEPLYSDFWHNPKDEEMPKDVHGFIAATLGDAKEL